MKCAATEGDLKSLTLGIQSDELSYLHEYRHYYVCGLM